MFSPFSRIVLVIATLQGTRDSSGVEQVERLLRQVPAAESAAAEERERPAALALPPAKLPDLVALLARGTFQDGEALSAEQTEVLLSTIASFPRTVLRTTLDKDLKRELDASTRSAWLKVIARFGLAPELGLALRIAADEKTFDIVQPDLREAVAAILRRDSSAASAIRRPIVDGSIARATTLVRAAGDSGCSDALPVLVDLLDSVRALDLVLLTEIGRLCEPAPKPIEEELLSRVEEHLDGSDVQGQREAALACGRAEDTGATAALIDLLAHEDRGVREAAEWALERISGLRFRNQARWQSWLRGEERWFEEEYPRTKADLARDVPNAVRALGNLLEHRHRRHELALELVPALEHADPGVRKLACLALGRLGSNAAVPALQARLEDDEREVRLTARSALEVLGVPVAEDESDESPPALKIPGSGVDHPGSPS